MIKERKSKAYMRGWLANLLIGAFMVALMWTFQYGIPEANEQLVTFMLGQLAGMATMSVAFYFGTSQSTTDQLEAIQQDYVALPPPERDRDRPLARGRDLPQPEFGDGMDGDKG